MKATNELMKVSLSDDCRNKALIPIEYLYNKTYISSRTKENLDQFTLYMKIIILKLGICKIKNNRFLTPKNTIKS